MRNTKTRRVYDYWLTLKGARVAPYRREVSPRGLKGTLPFVFMAERVGPDLTVFRLAGTGLCERYGRELRDHTFDAIWSQDERTRLRAFSNAVLETVTPGLITFRAETFDGRAVVGEMLLLPLADDTGAVTRLLGCAFATQTTSWLGQRPLVHQAIEASHFLEEDDERGITAEVAADLPVLRQMGHLRLVVSRETAPPADLSAAPEQIRTH